MMKTTRLLTTAALALVLGACASLGVPPAQTFLDKALAAQLSATAVLRSADTLLNAGAIGVSDAKNARATVATANQAIDIATTAYVIACPIKPASLSVDTVCTAPSADAKLASAVAILTVVQTYLQTKEKP